MSASLTRLDTHCWGVKGPQAEVWLHEQHLLPPHTPNTWTLLDNDPSTLILRLGANEFLLDAPLRSTADLRFQTLASELLEPVLGVYPVIREDVSLELGGISSDLVLAQAGCFPFTTLAVAERHVVMTLLFGVAAIVIARGESSARCYRIWCDPSYGCSLYASLNGIATACQ